MKRVFALILLFCVLWISVGHPSNASQGLGPEGSADPRLGLDASNGFFVSGYPGTLAPATFTIEPWFEREGAGIAGDTGPTAPLPAAPLAQVGVILDADPTLVAHFAMEEGSGGTILDSSTNGNNGTLSGNPTWEYGYDGLALDLDGIGDYAVVPDDPSLDIENEITLAAWIKPRASVTQRLIRKVDTGAKSGYSLYLRSNDLVSVKFNNSNSLDVSSVTNYWTVSNGGTDWMHVAATYDGATIRLYINGVQDPNSLSAAFTIKTHAQALSIGADTDGSNALNGQMDEVRVYNRALSLAEIEALATPPPAYTADLSITKDDGQTTATPGSPVIYTIAVSNNGPDYVLDATVTDTFPADLTGVTWTCTASAGASCSASGSGDINESVDLMYGNSVTYTVNATFDAGATGPLINTASVALPAGMTDPDPDNNSATDLDILSAWADQCGADPSLVGCWLMEEAGGATIYDSSGYGNHGTLYNDATRVAGQLGVGQALALDGTGDYALVPDDNSLDLDASLTIATWVKPEKVDTQDLVKKAIMDGTGGYELALAPDPSTMSPEGDGRPYARFDQPTYTDTYRINALTQYPVSGADWIHLAVTYDGVNMRLYYNGVLESTLPAAIPIPTNALPLGIGAQSDGTREFQGQMDEVRVYNRALSLAEIEVLATPPWDKADLSITKDDGLAIADPGDPVTYTISVMNDGPDDAIGAIVTDSFPLALTGATWICTAAGGASCTASGSGDISDTLDLPFASTATYVVTATFDLAATGNVSNTASVTPPPGVNDPDTGNNSATDVTDLGTPPEINYGLDFDGINDHVTFGLASDLGVTTFTIEAWIKREGTGVTASSGAGGITAVPLVTKGRGEADGDNRDMNYFLGIRGTDSVLAADFEDITSGGNHPVAGTTAIPADGAWHHVAATHDGTTWALYLDGNLEITQTASATPRWDSIQHAGLATAMTSLGTPSGYFDGVVDEVRIWDHARTQTEIQDNMHAELTSGTGLVGRWGMNEGSGTTITNTVSGGSNGTLVNGPVWVFGFPDPDPPAAPQNLLAAAGSTVVGLSWDANTEFDLAGYNVYRSGTSPVPTDTAPINASLVISPTYTDSGLVNGTTYYYLVTALDRSDNESGPSNEVTVTPLDQEAALDFGSAAAYVTFGDPGALDLATFTLETWFKREGPGATAYTGPSGSNGIPLVTKGRGESDNNSKDMNYFLGICDSAGVVLCAEFEEGAGGISPGANHPVFGTTTILTDTWYHAAATYDGTTWQLYLNGLSDAQLTVGQPPRSDSIQHAALGTALNSSGVSDGHFDGVLDEARIWDHARTQIQIQDAINDQIASGPFPPGLVARWGLDEGLGTGVYSVPTPSIDGALTNPGGSWVSGAPFDIVVTRPAAPTDLSATPTIGTQIDLAWTDNSDNESGFEIERSATGSGGPFSLLNTVVTDTLGYRDWGLASGGEYCYRVRATNAGGVSDYTGVACATTPAIPQNALDFGGTDAYVTFGNPAELHLAAFTLEAWFRRDGIGATTDTGTGGLTSAVPLVTRGKAETENPDVDMNYFMGIHAATNVLAADFEEGAGGSSPSQNHPVNGTTIIAADGTWHHAAAAYDGATWWLYLDGELEATLDVNEPPAAAGNQHAAIGSAQNSIGVAAGFFDGVVDEVRIWDRALTQTEIRTNINQELTSGTGLVARWGLNEGSGTAVSDSAGTPTDGTIAGSNYAWAPGAPFDMNYSPDVPSSPSPGDDATGVGLAPELTVNVSDPEGDPLTVTFYGREANAGLGENFTVVALPDTQYYTVLPGLDAIFYTQTQWISHTQAMSNIVFVSHLGDLVQNGDDDTDDSEWTIADAAMSILENAPVFTDGIPYGISVGNHDVISGTTNYEDWFGVARFSGRSYYGGNYGSDNLNNYDTFSASGMDFIVVNIDCTAYLTAPATAVLDWADALLKADTTRRGIVACHHILTGSEFSPPGQAIYDALKDNPNFFLLLGGHADTAGRRSDAYNGTTVHSLRSDYQSQPNGGNGWLRIMEFEPDSDQIQVTTYSPWLDQQWDPYDHANNFTLSYDMSGGFTFIGTNSGVASGTSTSMSWPGRDPDTEYEWYVTVSDGNKTTSGPIWSFTAASSMTYDLDLSAGWNLISWPLAAVSSSITDTLLSSCSACDQAWAYDASDGADPWKQWPGDLHQVDEKQGLWLHTTVSSTVTITGGQPVTRTIELRAGWNLVGYPSQTARPVADALLSIAGQYTRVRTYDLGDPADLWKQYDVGLPVYANDLAMMEPGRGYWVHVTADCTWTVDP